MSTPEELFGESIYANRQLKEIVKSKVGEYDEKVKQLETQATEGLSNMQQDVAVFTADAVGHVDESVNSALGDGRITVYVDQLTGIDTNPGTQIAPFKSIDKAISANMRYQSIHIYVSGNYKTTRREHFHHHLDVNLYFDGSTLEFGRARVDVGGDINITQESKDSYGSGWALFGFYGIGNLHLYNAKGNILIPKSISDGDDAVFGDMWNVLLLSVAFQFSWERKGMRLGVHLAGASNYGSVFKFINPDGSISKQGLSVIVGTAESGKFRPYRFADKQLLVNSQDCVFSYLDDTDVEVNETSPVNTVPEWFLVGHHSHGLQRSLDAANPIERI